MTRDRFLTGILIGIAALVLLAVILFFIRRDQIRYVDEGTPEGVMQNYILALHQRDYERAYAYLADQPNRPTFDQFRQPFLTYQSQMVASTAVEIGETVEDASGQTATVQLVFLHDNGGDIFAGSSRELQTASLIRQGEQWKISTAPYPFWSYEWDYLPKSALIAIAA